jgi:hypothetical protein
MADDLAALSDLRAEIVTLANVLRNPGTPSLVRQRTALALAEASLKICDVALSLLRERQPPPQEEDDLV